MYKAIVFLCLITMSCGGTINMEEEKQKLLETDREFAQISTEIGPAEAFNKFLLKEALMLPDGGIPIQGRESIFSAMKADDSGYQLEWIPEDGKVAASLDLGYSWGNYTATRLDENGNAIKNHGKYLNVWKKDANGAWKVLVDMGNKNPLP